MSHVKLASVTKRFGNVVAAENISIDVEEGEFVTLLGPSGCGKTTTLRMIAGLEKPTSGEIQIEGETVNDVPVHERNIGMVFQNYALFPHKSVGENVAFPLKMRGVSKSERRDRAEDALEMVKLPGMASRSISQLSGGQRQRVALARSLVYEPSVLLMDEPLSALDRVLRQEMRVEIKRLQDEFGITTIYVTHDQMEAFTLSDRVVILEDGKKVQEGKPVEIYEQPASGFTAEFIGRSTKFTGRVDVSDPDRPVMRTDEGMAFTLPKKNGYVEGNVQNVYLRSEKLRISPTPTNEPNEIPVKIKAVNFLGEKTNFICEYEGKEIIVSTQGFSNVNDFSAGSTAYVTIPPEEIITTKEVAE